MAEDDDDKLLRQLRGLQEETGYLKRSSTSKKVGIDICFMCLLFNLNWPPLLPGSAFIN